MKFKIIKEYLIYLEHTIQQFLDNGYTLIGSPTYDPLSELWVQAMIKPK